MEVSAEGLARFFEVVLPHLNERQRRAVLGATSEMLHNKTAVADASGMSRNTVIKAEAEVAAGMEPAERQRPPGAGRKQATELQPGLLEDLDELVHPETRGRRCRSCVGRRSRRRSWPTSSCARATRCRLTRWGDCSRCSATPSRRRQSRKKAPATPTATLSSAT